MTKSKKELTSKVVQLVKENFDSFNDQQKVLQIIRIALLDYEPQAQIEALKQLSDKLNVHTAKYHPDCPFCEVLDLIDQQIKEMEKWEVVIILAKVMSKSKAAKEARHGDDMGKKGKNFSKIASRASKEYGSSSAGKKVAGAIFQKMRRSGKLWFRLVRL